MDTNRVNNDPRLVPELFRGLSPRRWPAEEAIMKMSRLAGAACALAIVMALPAAAHDLRETVTPQFKQSIPNIPGKSLVAVVVDYAPGAASPAHLHAKSAFIYAYVLSGAVESQVDDGPKRIFRAGESFHEPPGASHRVSRNASGTEPAKLLAVFVVDGDEKVLTRPLE